MSNWWEGDPVAPAQSQTTSGDDWWKSDPVAETSTVSDIAKSAGSGLVKGAIGAAAAGPLAIHGIAHAVAAAVNYLAPDSDFAKSLNKGFDQAEANRKAIQGALGPQFYEHTPQTTAGEYAQTAGEFLPQAISGPGGLVRRVATQAIVPAVASETAGQVFKGTPLEPVARAGGALAGGAAGAVASVPRTTERALSSRLPDYVTPDHVNQAEDLINNAAQRGVTLTWPEALSQVTGKPVLTDMQRLLESSAETRGHMGNVLAHRPEQFDKAALDELNRMTPISAAPSMLGKQTQEAAKGTLSDVRQLINEHTAPGYDATRAMKISPEDMKTVEATPGYQQLRDEVRNNPHLNENVKDLPDDSVGFLNEVKQLYDQKAKNVASKLSPDQNQNIAASLTRGARTVRDIAAKNAPAYDIALQAQSQARRQYLEPLMSGPLGKMAKSPDTQHAINALFPEKPLANSQLEVSTAVSGLTKRNPWAASQLVRAHLEGNLNDAVTRLVGNENQFGAAGFAKTVIGNPQKLENLKAAVQALPDGQSRWDTLSELLDIARATGQRQPIGSRTAFNAQDLKEMTEGGGPLVQIGKLASPKILDTVRDAVMRWQAGQNMESLAKIITDPRAGDTFRKLATARQSPDAKRKIWLLMGRLIGQSATGERGSGGSQQPLQVRIPAG